MPATSEELFARLAELEIPVRTVTHPPLFTVSESKALRGQLPGGHSKNLFLKDKKGGYFLVSVEEDAAVDLKTLHNLIGASGRLSFGSPDRLMEYLGVAPGAVTLFGVVNDKAGMVKVVVDAGLAAHDVVNAHPLTNEATTSIRRDDLIRFLEAERHPPAILKVTA